MSVDEAFRRLMEQGSGSGLRAGGAEAEASAPAATEEPSAAGEPSDTVAAPEESAPPPLDDARFQIIQRLAHHPIDRRSQIAEEYRILRTRLQAISLPKPSVLFTSCHHNEGKTSTALNLSLALAGRQSARILLVDFDLRRPRLYKMLGLPRQGPDIVSVLHDECDPEEAIYYSRDDNLHVLGARRDCAGGTDLLETAHTREFIERLHRSFDFVLVDSCPCLSTSDPAILGPYLGGVVMVVRCLQTQRESIEHAINSLTELGVEVNGVVLTFMRYFIPRYLYRYQYYHGYYYRGYNQAYGADAAEEDASAASDAEPVPDQPDDTSTPA